MGRLGLGGVALTRQPLKKPLNHSSRPLFQCLRSLYPPYFPHSSPFSTSPFRSKKTPSSQSPSLPQASPPPSRQNPPRPTLDPSTVTANYLKGSGPGGQKINKTTSAVQLTHVPTGIVVKCQETRSKTQNEKIARRNLAVKVDRVLRGEESWEAGREREEGRRKGSAKKKSKRKYKKLEEAKRGSVGTDGEEGEEMEGEDEGDVGGEIEMTERVKMEVKGEGDGGRKETQNSGADSEDEIFDNDVDGDNDAPPHPMNPKPLPPADEIADSPTRSNDDGNDSPPNPMNPKPGPPKEGH